MTPVSPLDRMWLAFRTLVRGELAELRFLGAYRYVVRGSSLGLVDVEPASQTLGLPSLGRVPVLPGVMGEEVIATVGAACVVVFLDGDPTLPRVLSVSGVDECRIAGGTGTWRWRPSWRRSCRRTRTRASPLASAHPALPRPRQLAT